MRYGKKRKPITRLLSLITALALALPGQSAAAVTEGSKDDYEELVSEYATADDRMGYTDYLARNPQVRPDRTIEICAADLVRYEENGAEASPRLHSDYEGMPGSSVLTAEDSLIEFEVTVEQAGLYDLSLVYYPVPGKNSAIQRCIFLDGQLPYEELSLVEFQRVWKMDAPQAAPNTDGVSVISWSKDNQGNDLKPSSVEIPQWTESYVYDSEGYITTELSLYLTEGEHTLTLIGLREPMLLNKLILSNRTNAQSYEAVKQAWDAAGAADTSGHILRIEAENASRTSSQMLYAQQDQSSPAVYPSSPKVLLNNTIGGNSWRLTGQWMEWDFEVPQSGYYNISLFARQNFVKGITEEDMALIHQPLDFMGENIYNGIMLEADENGEPRYVPRDPGFPLTGNDWPVTPECFRWGLRFLYERYKTPIYVTENGMCNRDVISSDGKVHDPQRIDFLNRYILAMKKAMDEGADIRGYFQWTLTDNFEWSCGYRDKFGLVYVDFATQRRYLKDSAFWFAKVISTQGKCLQPDKTPLFLREEEGDYIVCEGPRTGARYRSDTFRFLGRFEDGLITVVVNKSWLMKVERGYGRVDSISVRPGDILLLPENYGNVTLSGDMTVSVEEKL